MIECHKTGGNKKMKFDKRFFLVCMYVLLASTAGAEIFPGPITSWNKTAKVPKVSETAYVSLNASVIGEVYIGDNVYIAPGASVRGDEGVPIYIGSGTNIQDGVIIHALKDKFVMIEGKKYAVYIGKDVCVAHGAIIHGPCAIGDGSFVGFNSTVFKAIVGKNCAVLHHSLVTNNVKIPDNKCVPSGTVIDSQHLASTLGNITEDVIELKKEVVEVNKEFAAGY
ncbi:carbonate dehydratase [Candidatus Desantisbacteria bacterium CG_4_10_14_3_um_filter_40_18]|nr:MAG: carbonate dehydratase [Candidatus Desantisbacteria bacterium CG_4_10_14_3_um_filter_40_18]